MSQLTQLQSADGHKFSAYVAQPAGAVKAGVVVLQEIYGVTEHIRAVVDRFAQEGDLTIAPCLFDRLDREANLAYDGEGARRGMNFVQRLKLDETLADIAASIQFLRDSGAAKVGVVGFCWGGSLAWLANTRLHADATVSYYPGQIAQYIHERFTCPAMFHFGLRDKHIPQNDVQEVRHEYPGFPVYTYDADHAFNRDGGPNYNEAAAHLAWKRTLAHLSEFLA